MLKSLDYSCIEIMKSVNLSSHELNEQCIESRRKVINHYIVGGTLESSHPGFVISMTWKAMLLIANF